MVAEFNEHGDLVIWVNVTCHTASFLLGYVVVVAKESLKLLVLVRFQLSHPFYCPIAQLAEQETVNFKVARSSRAGTANLL